jgi:hypothetical protein
MNFTTQDIETLSGDNSEKMTSNNVDYENDEKCDYCEKKLGEKEGFLLEILDVEGNKCPHCNNDWDIDDILVCSKRCLKEHCAWTVSWKEFSIEILDECSHCGRNIYDMCSYQRTNFVNGEVRTEGGLVKNIYDE